MSPTKDRLNEMIQLQNGGKDSHNLDTEEKKSLDINKTFQKAELIRENIEVIKRNTARANDILKNNVFKISKDLQDELDSLFSVSTSTAYKINNTLKEFENDLRKIKTSELTQYRIKKVQYSTLKQEFQNVLRESSNSLEFHKNNRKELLKKSLKAAHGDVNEEELESLLDENKLDVFTDNHLITEKEARLQLADIKERHKELLKIERHLNEVLDLFIKLATLVEQQQESVDRVEFHAEAATDCIELGAREIQSGAKSKTKFRKRKIYCILFAIVFLLFIVLIVLVAK